MKMKPNIKQVAQEANVSTATVSRVLNRSGYVSDDVVQRVYEAVEKLGYRMNAIARSLKQDRTQTIGVIVPDISNPYFMQLARGLEDVVQAAGYHLIFGSSDERAEKEDKLLELMHGRRTDAIVLASASRRGSELLEPITRSGTPVLLIDRRIENEGVELDTFVESNAKTACALAEKLIEDGHRSIGVIHGGKVAATAVERLEGVEEAFRRHGIAWRPELAVDGKYSEEGGAAAAKRLLQMKEDRRPTAILSLNNVMSFGALLELARIGANIPGDVALASFGELPAAALWKNSRIWAAVQKPYAMGKAVGERLLERFGEDEERSGERARIVQEVFEPMLDRLK
ncbi:LacI family DNA-binding transcriptional regulator [Paenibacillus koleovorans]|uniref:LacI family DNA-binding transcriptional regulator n=1 Tax=Paenibacillus koleovorans TaxID=121608 RepID=UPI001FE850D5|nr:LacI family DNA-binding transcriptional regulator [Paenibacillus koleovorans]